MDLLSLEGVSKVLLPACTFVLGVVVTLITKRVEKRRAEVREHVSTVAKLVNDWYNQVHSLVVDAETQGSTPEKTRAIYFYVHNRLILPELMLHLEFLRRRQAVPALLSATDDFLALVTDFQPPTKRTLPSRRGDMYRCKMIIEASTADAPAMTSNARALLGQLDAKLQEVTKLSAHTLATEA